MNGAERKGAVLKLAPRRSSAEMAEACRSGQDCPAGRWLACPFGAEAPGSLSCRQASAERWESLLEAPSGAGRKEFPDPGEASAAMLEERCRKGLCSKLEFDCPFGAECAEGRLPSAAQWLEALNSCWPPIKGPDMPSLAGWDRKQRAVPSGLGLYWMKHPYAFSEQAALVRVAGAAAPGAASIVLPNHPNGPRIIVHVRDYIWAGPLPEEEQDGRHGQE